MGSKVKQYDKPDFIGVGMRKCGTTWLHAQLREHPEIYMPTIKEFRFFFEGVFIPKHNLWTLFISKERNYRQLRKKIPRMLRYRKFKNSRTRFFEFIRFTFVRHSYHWYTSFFNSVQISGEFTPGTWAVPEEKVEEISQYFPNAKIIFLIRDPVSRLWSNFKMNVKQNDLDVNFSKVSRENKRIVALLKETKSYVAAIEKWKRHFREVKVLYYDKLVEENDEFLSDVFRFIGCQDVRFKNSKPEQVKNKGLSHEIPAALEKYLIEFYLPYVDELIEYDSSAYPKKWKKQYQTRLSELESLS